MSVQCSGCIGNICATNARVTNNNDDIPRGQNFSRHFEIIIFKNIADIEKRYWTKLKRFEWSTFRFDFSFFFCTGRIQRDFKVTDFF